MAKLCPLMQNEWTVCSGLTMTIDNLSFKYVADPECPYFLHTLRGQPTLAEVGQRLQAVFDHPEGGPLTAAIWDVRGADLSQITLNTGIDFTDDRPAAGTARANARSCTVVSNKRDFAIIRQFYAMIDLVPENRNIVFSLEEAINWLKSSG